MGRREFVLPEESGQTYAPKRPRLMAIADMIVQRNNILANSEGTSALHNVHDGPDTPRESEDADDDEDHLDNEWNILDDDDADNLSPFDVETQEGALIEDTMPTTTGNEQGVPSQPVPTPHNILDPTNRFSIDLLNLCHEAKIPLVYYDRFVRAIKKGAERDVKWKKIPSRARLNTILRDRFPTCLPQMIPVPNTQDLVPKFSFMDQLLDLFSGKYFKGPEAIPHCCINADQNTRFQKYIVPTGEGLAEVTGGSWYRNTHDKFIGEHLSEFLDPISGLRYKNWLVPIIIYNDKTGVSAMEGSYSLEPLMFTIGLIRRSFRENPDAWRHLGFIPSFSGYDIEEDTGEQKRKKASPEESLSFTHECMSILLKDLAELQDSPPLLTVEIFGEVCRLRLILQVAFVIGDQLSQDTHCCRKKVNAGGAGRVHRSCMASFSNATTLPTSDTGCCNYVPKSVIDSLCKNIWFWESQDADSRRSLAHFIESHIITAPPPSSTRTRSNTRTQQTASLRIPSASQQRKSIERTVKVRSQLSRDILEKVFSIYPVKNAWSMISFGCNENGIHRATLDDPMHYNSSGLCAYILEIAFQGLLPTEAKRLETYLQEDFKTRSSVRYDLPLGKFNNGFTNCTLQTASEKVGLIYALYLSLDTPRVAALYETSIFRQQRKYCDFSCFRCSTSSSCSRSNSGHPVNKFDDKYFFKDGFMESETSEDSSDKRKMPRDINGVGIMMEHLDMLGLLSGNMQRILPLFDSLQVEYLFQSCFNRVTWHTQKEEHPLIIHEGLFQRVRSSVVTTSLAKKLHSVLRQNPDDEESHRIVVKMPGRIQDRIEKHWIVKPKLKGSGNTSAVLTNVQGFRKLLEKVLLFHALVHEFHQIDSKFHTTEYLLHLQGEIHQMLNDIFRSIYRGDHSIDVQTCKCHSHFHLIQDIQEFGAPMGFDASKGERNLKVWAKGYSKTARKCGQNIFIEQTARRVSDHMVLQRVNHLLHNVDQRTRTTINVDPPGTNVNGWNYTRKTPHLRYDLSSQETRTSDDVVVDCRFLLADEVKELLKKEHGSVGEIRIWKEIKVNQGEGQGYHFVRAFDKLDNNGSFFDWAEVDFNPDKLANNDPPEEPANKERISPVVDNHEETSEQPDESDEYRPAQVLLLYQTSDQTNHAIIWSAAAARASEYAMESNLTARWTMEFDRNKRAAIIQVIPTKRIRSCISVYRHWRQGKKDRKIQHPLEDLKNIEGPANGYTIDEQYSVYAWLLNLVDSNRWRGENPV